MPFVRGVWMRGVSVGALGLSLLALSDCEQNRQNDSGFRLFG